MEHFAHIVNISYYSISPVACHVNVNYTESFPMICQKAIKNDMKLYHKREDFQIPSFNLIVYINSINYIIH